MLSSIVSIFAREDSLDGAFLDVYTSMDLGVLTLDEDKRIRSKYDKCAIPFYKYIFSIFNIRFPFNYFEIDVLNHQMLTHVHQHPVSWEYVKVLQY